MKTLLSGSGPISILSLVFRFCLAMVFFQASLDKISAPAEFAIAVENYRLVPAMFSNTIAILLPWIEFWCGIALLAGIWQRGSAVLLSIMCIIFIGAMLSVMMRGLEIDCGCFGAGSGVNAYRVIEDIVLLLMSLSLAKHPSDKFTLTTLFTKKNKKPMQMPGA